MKTAVVPAGGDFVELAATSKGKLFKKQILPFGQSFVHPKNPKAKIMVDETFAKALVKNFNDGICDTVQFPMVNEANQHVEDPNRNLGQVVDLTYDSDGVWATLDVRKHADDIGSTILGASAMMSLDYTRTDTGEKVGPTLLHVAATNRPYLTKLAPYEPVALSASDDECVVLSRVEDTNPGSETPMELEDLLAALKDDHGIDVIALQEQVALSATEHNDGNQELLAALSNVLKAADSSLVALSAVDEDNISVDDVAMGVVELSRNYADVTGRLETLETAAAAGEVDALVSAGKILPAQRDAMLELRLSNEELFEALVPDNAIVSLSETGVTTHESTTDVGLKQAETEVERLLNLSKNSKISAV